MYKKIWIIALWSVIWILIAQAWWEYKDIQEATSNTDWINLVTDNAFFEIVKKQWVNNWELIISDQVSVVDNKSWKDEIDIKDNNNEKIIGEVISWSWEIEPKFFPEIKKILIDEKVSTSKSELQKAIDNDLNTLVKKYHIVYEPTEINNFYELIVPGSPSGWNGWWWANDIIIDAISDFNSNPIKNSGPKNSNGSTMNNNQTTNNYNTSQNKVVCAYGTKLINWKCVKNDSGTKPESNKIEVIWSNGKTTTVQTNIPVIKIEKFENINIAPSSTFSCEVANKDLIFQCNLEKFKLNK